MSKKNRIYIGESEEVDFDIQVSVSELSKRLGGDAETFIFVVGEDEPLDSKQILAELEDQRRKEIVHSACRRVKVAVMYLTGVKEAGFAPSVKIAKVKRAFAELFGIDASSVPDMGLFLENSNDPLDEQRPLQFYLKKGICSIRLELATKEGWQG